MLKSQGLDVSAGQSVQLQISQNPSNGYKWLIDSSASKSLWSVLEGFQPAMNTEEGMTGIAGVKKYTLNIDQKEGEGMFRAVLVRPYKFGGFDAATFKEADYEPRNIV